MLSVFYLLMGERRNSGRERKREKGGRDIFETKVLSIHSLGTISEYAALALLIVNRELTGLSF